MKPVLVVHGGAGALASDEDRRLYLQGVSDALDAGLAALARDAKSAVLAAVEHLERHSICNAGVGAVLAADGAAWLDAGYMCGTTRRYGGVTGVRDCPVPVRLAERLSHEGDFGRLLSPPGVDGLAAEWGLPTCANEELITARTRRIWEERRALRAAPPPAGLAPFLDTVGAVALDAGGHVAAAVSTGGTSWKRRGRVGDSPIVGAGYWADDARGACVTTGVGEALLRQGTARRAVELLTDSRTPLQAARAALAELVDHEGDARGTGGLILVAPDGTVALDHNSREMSAGWAQVGGGRRVTHLWRGA